MRADLGQVLIGIAAIISATLSGIAAVYAARCKTDIQKVEIATNSMKDQLVAATKIASHAEGMAQQRQDHADSLKGKINPK